MRMASASAIAVSDARLADQAGIVLLSAAENLNHARQFPVTPDDVVELSFPRKVGQIPAVGGQKLQLFLLLFPFAVVLDLVGSRCAVCGLGRFGRNESRVAEQFRKVDGGRAAVLGIIAIGWLERLSEHFSEVILGVFQLFGGNSELVDHVSDDVVNRNAQLFCAFHAKTPGGLFPVFHPRHKHDCHALVAL